MSKHYNRIISVTTTIITVSACLSRGVIIRIVVLIRKYLPILSLTVETVEGEPVHHSQAVLAMWPNKKEL